MESSPKVTPIEAQHLSDVGQFLHENLNRRFSAERWVQSVTHAWSESRPNYGMQLRDGNRLVGVFLAIYSDQLINGRSEKFCNPHSWCVLEEYRRHSIGLVLHLIKQKGYHFTMYTPNPKVTEVFRGLKFRDLDPRQYIMPNFPTLSGMFGGAFVESDPARIGPRLNELARAEYEAHKDIPWLKFAAFGGGGESCLAIFKPGIWKRLPSARIMHVSHPDVFLHHGHLLRSHLLLKHHFVTSRIEARWLSAAPRVHLKVQRMQPKLFQSTALAEGYIRDVYSELMSLDV